MFFFLKRIFDILFSLILLICTLPILLITAVSIKLEDPKGPIFHKPKRVGFLNKEFVAFKFRSMTVSKEKNSVKLTDKERMLVIGKLIRKFSIDELPQLINILKGEMSFIGPRPLPIVYLLYYTKNELIRHSVKPGISGWAQIN